VSPEYKRSSTAFKPHDLREKAKGMTFWSALGIKKNPALALLRTGKAQIVHKLRQISPLCGVQ